MSEHCDEDKANLESVAVFPGLVESIDAKDYTNAIRWTGIIEECIKTATAHVKVGHHG